MTIEQQLDAANRESIIAHDSIERVRKENKKLTAENKTLAGELIELKEDIRQVRSAWGGDTYGHLNFRDSMDAFCGDVADANSTLAATVIALCPYPVPCDLMGKHGATARNALAFAAAEAFAKAMEATP